VALPLANPLSAREYNRIHKTRRVSICLQALRLWHLASFDAPTVAVVWAYVIAKVEGVHLLPWVALLLFSGTWTVYVGDRLLDAYRAMRSSRLDALRERHFFHWHHRHTLVPLAACSAAFAATLVAHLMPVVVRERNSVLAAAALMYFSGVHSTSRFPAWLRTAGWKELLVGILFTAGCATPTLSQIHFGVVRVATVWPFFLCLGFLAVLAWCNCRAIDRWESAESSSEVRFHACLLVVAGATISVALAWTHAGPSALIASATASSFLLLILDRMRFRVSPLTLRALADLVLLTPAVLFAVGAGSA
jgi:hypothetical protein